MDGVGVLWISIQFAYGLLRAGFRFRTSEVGKRVQRRGNGSAAPTQSLPKMKHAFLSSPGGNLFSKSLIFPMISLGVPVRIGGRRARAECAEGVTSGSSTVHFRHAPRGD